MGPCGENIAGGTNMCPEMAANMWHDESPENGPNCGGHCTAMLWKVATKLGCGLQKDNSSPMAVCRYGGGTLQTAANFGGSSAKQANVGYPDSSKEDECLKKWPFGAGQKPGGKPQWR